MKKSSWQDRMRESIVSISSFPGFFIPIFLYALLVADIEILGVFLLSLLILALLQTIIKYIFPTMRPQGYTKDHKFIPVPVDGSFPSNHAAGAFLLYFFVQATIPGLHFLFLFFALLVALSRIHLHKHHPIDIVGAFITSYLVFFLAAYVFGFLG